MILGDFSIFPFFPVFIFTWFLWIRDGQIVTEFIYFILMRKPPHSSEYLSSIRERERDSREDWGIRVKEKSPKGKIPISCSQDSEKKRTTPFGV